METRKCFKWCYFSQKHISYWKSNRNLKCSKSHTTPLTYPLPTSPPPVGQFKENKQTKLSLCTLDFSLSLCPSPLLSNLYCRHHSKISIKSDHLTCTSLLLPQFLRMHLSPGHRERLPALLVSCPSIIYFLHKTTNYTGTQLFPVVFHLSQNKVKILAVTSFWLALRNLCATVLSPWPFPPDKTNRTHIKLSAHLVLPTQDAFLQKSSWSQNFLKCRLLEESFSSHPV